MGCGRSFSDAENAKISTLKDSFEYVKPGQIISLERKQTEVKMFLENREKAT